MGANSTSRSRHRSSIHVKRNTRPKSLSLSLSIPLFLHPRRPPPHPVFSRSHLHHTFKPVRAFIISLLFRSYPIFIHIYSIRLLGPPRRRRPPAPYRRHRLHHYLVLLFGHLATFPFLKGDGIHHPSTQFLGPAIDERRPLLRTREHVRVEVRHPPRLLSTQTHPLRPPHGPTHLLLHPVRLQPTRPTTPRRRLGPSPPEPSGRCGRLGSQGPLGGHGRLGSRWCCLRGVMVTGRGRGRRGGQRDLLSDLSVAAAAAAGGGGLLVASPCQPASPSHMQPHLPLGQPPLPTDGSADGP